MMDEARGRRYALYYTPAPEHPLRQAAAQWLGRDVFGQVDTFANDRSSRDVLLTAEARRYGFHATLKAPFRLAPGTSRQELGNAIRRSTGSRWPYPIGPMRVARLRGFFALVPSAAPSFLRSFASQVVSEFDHFRAQMTTRDLQRRLRARLGATGTTNFEWSYPCVFERFRFHMTLTGPVAIDERKGVARCLETRFQQRLTKTSPSDEITLFEQQSQKSDFVAILRFEFRELQRVAG